jgi:hypothetical protein
MLLVDFYSESDSKLECWKQKINGRFFEHGGRFSTLVFCLLVRQKSVADLEHSVADFTQEIKQKRIFGPDLLQFYEGYFFYKYRICIRVNLEIEGAETRV